LEWIHNPGIFGRFVFDYDFSYLALDVQEITNTSAAVNAVALGNTEALRSYKRSVEGSLVLEGAFTKAQELAIMHEAGVPIFFSGGTTVVSDHTVLHALRKLIRQQHERLNAVAATTVPTLVIGSAMREINLYAACEHVKHYIHGAETKDYGRTVRPMLSAIAKKVRAGTSKTKPGSANKLEKPGVKIYRSLCEIADSLAKLESWHDRFLCKPEDIKPNFERLVFEDIYDLAPADYRTLFLSSGANEGVGYGFYPDELLFPDCAPCKHYAYSYDPITMKSSVAYRFGVSNGYRHDHAKWASFLRNPVMVFPEFKLVFEITSRIGPFMTYSITKMPVDVADPVVRRFELRENRQFVRVLDVRASVNTAGFVSNKRTFAVLQDEWDAAVNWTLSLDPKSVTFANIVSQVRRIAGGVSLVNKELTKAWELPKSRYADFSLAVLIYAKKIIADSSKLERVAEDSPKSTFSLLKATFSLPFSVFENAAHFALRSNIVDHVVEYPVGYVETRQALPMSSLRALADPAYRTTISPDGELGTIHCETCEALDGQLGKQKIRCAHAENDKLHVLAFSEDERNKVLNELRSDDMDAAGLAKIKKRVIDRVPKQDAHTEVRIHYIEGGPGTGKSYIIRKLADDDSDCVYLPFNKLMSDYAEFEDGGRRRKLRCATVHRGLELPACEKLFVDEFTALDWVYIKMVAINTGCTDLYLVGDVKQTRIQDPTEGTYVGNVVNMDTLPTHTLLVNFRNPGHDIALLNAHHGYDMEHGSSKLESGISVLHVDDYRPTPGPMAKMFFTHAAAKKYADLDENTTKEKYTVRAYQGSTVDDALLYLCEADSAVMQVHGMDIVALSRHKKTLTIVHDGSAVAVGWLERYGIYTQDSFNEFLSTWKNPTHSEGTNKSDRAAAEESQVIKDFYAGLEEYSAPEYARRDLLVLSKPQVLTLIAVVLRVLPLADTLVANIVTVMLAGSALGYGLRDLFVLRFTSPLALLSSMFSWFLRSVYLSLPALFLAFRAPGSVVTSVVHVGPLAPQPLVHLLLSIYLPTWLRSGPIKEILLMPFTSLAVLGTRLHMVETLPGLGPLRSLATILNHFSELPRLPETLLRSCYKPLPFVTLLAVVWYRTRCATPSFVVYASFPSDQLHFVSSDWLACLSVPNVKAAVQLHSVDYVIPDQWLRAVVATVKFSVNYVETSGRFWVRSMFTSHKLEKQEDLEAPIIEGRYVTPRDSYLGSFDGVPTDQDPQNLPMNAIGSSVAPANFKSGTINLWDFVNPINTRGHPGKPGVTRRFLNGLGHTFSQKSPAQMLNVLANRYLNRKSRAPKPLDAEGMLLARAMVREFLHEHTDIADLKFSLDDLLAIELEADAAARVKHYDAQLQGIDNPMYSTVRAHLKDIFKPSPKKTFDELKPGQGISAWSKDAQVTFGTAIRYANFLFQRSLKSHVVFDNRMTVDQVFKKLRAAMERVPTGAVNGVTDFTMFDAQQDQFTQHIEKEFLLAFGFSERFVDEYYRLRVNYKIQAGPMSGTAGTEKTSGEPGTLLFNSVVNAVIMNFLLRGEGPQAVALKGDDGFKRQVNLKIDEVRRGRVAQYTRLQIKISFEDPAEFCGCVIGQGAMAPNLYRRLVSIHGKTFKDYHAFALYQVSLRDWLQIIIARGPEARAEILALNTAVFTPAYQDPCLTFSSMEAVLDQLVSFSHISEDQFNAATVAYTEVIIHMAADGSPMLSGGASANNGSAKELSQKEIWAAARRYAIRQLNETTGVTSEEEIELSTRRLVGAGEGRDVSGIAGVALGKLGF